MQVPDRPQRIVALNDGNGGAQILSLGVPLVGLATRGGVLDPVNVGMPGSDVLDDVTSIGEYFEHDHEAIAALQPDLIVGYAIDGEVMFDDEDVARLEQIAPFVAPATFEPVIDVMAAFGELLGVDAEAERQRAEFEQRVADIRSRMAVDPADLSVAHFYLFGADDFRVNRRDLSSVTQALEAILGPDIWTAPIYDDFTDSQQESFSLERIPDLHADLVIHNHQPQELTASTRALLDALPAARAGHLREEPDPNEVPMPLTYDGLRNALDFVEPILTDPDLDADVA